MDGYSGNGLDTIGPPSGHPNPITLASFAHSIELSGKSLKAATGKDLEVCKPIPRRNLATLDFNGTLP